MHRALFLIELEFKNTYIYIYIYILYFFFLLDSQPFKDLCLSQSSSLSRPFLFFFLSYYFSLDFLALSLTLLDAAFFYVFLGRSEQSSSETSSEDASLLESTELTALARLDSFTFFFLALCLEDFIYFFQKVHWLLDTHLQAENSC